MKSKRSSPICARAILLCAGSGQRTNLGYNKMLYGIGKKTLLETTLDALLNSSLKSVTVVAARRDLDTVRELTAGYDRVTAVTEGGATRFESVKNGLTVLGDCDAVVIHDGARPFVSAKLIEDSIDSAVKHGSGIAALPAVDTVRELDEGGSLRTLDRKRLYLMQTPQTFRYSEIKDAYSKAKKNDYYDDAEVFEEAGYPLTLIEGERGNIKITSPEDLLKLDRADLKIGTGFDVHAFGNGGKTILGGIEIPYKRGFIAHSDGDVLLHAVMDAVLSAAGLPDIGVLFPDTDAAYENADSGELLRQVVRRTEAAGYRLKNISAVVMAQEPKLAGHIPAIRENLARLLGISVDDANVSATTTERLGIIGEGKGVAVSATCLTERLR